MFLLEDAESIDVAQKQDKGEEYLCLRGKKLENIKLS